MAEPKKGIVVRAAEEFREEASNRMAAMSLRHKARVPDEYIDELCTLYNNQLYVTGPDQRGQHHPAVPGTWVDTGSGYDTDEAANAVGMRLPEFLRSPGVPVLRKFNAAGQLQPYMWADQDGEIRISQDDFPFQAEPVYSEEEEEGDSSEVEQGQRAVWPEYQPAEPVQSSDLGSLLDQSSDSIDWDA